MSFTIDDSAYPAHVTKPINQFPAGSTVRAGSTYFFTTAPDGNGNVQVYAPATGEIVPMPGSAVVEGVAATLVVTALA